MLSSHFALLINVLLARLVHSTPVYHATATASVFYLDIRQADNSSVQSNIHNVTLFNLTIVTREINAITTKYAKAQQFLQGIDVHPDTHPEAGYPQFVPPDTSGALLANVQQSPSPSPPPPLPAASAPSSQLLHTLTDPDPDPGRDPDPAAGIIVPPMAPGAIQLPLKDDISGALDVLYYGPLDFGAPTQSLTVDIDTGSADLWVPEGCQGCGNAQFFSRRSSSFRRSSTRCSITYGSGKVSGTLASDTVGVGPASVSEQTFCAVRKVSADLNDEPNSGLLGLAFGSIAQSGRATFFENLLAQKKLAQSVFSVHLTRAREAGSQVCFGCFDATKAMGPVHWNSVISRTYWSIAMNGLSVNKTLSVSANLTAAVDTGTSLIYVPSGVAEDFYALIPGSASAVQYGAGFYTVPCDTTASISLILNGETFSIHPSDFNLGETDVGSKDCVGGILALGNGFPQNLAIIGDEFLKSWYSVFDYSGRVGFARSVNNM